VTDQPPGSLIHLTAREHRWLEVLLVLSTVAAAFVVLGFITALLSYFQDIIFTFFLAWLLAFVLSPVANVLTRLVPGLPRAIAVVISYSLLIAALLAVLVLLAQQLSTSITTLVNNWPSPDRQREMLQPWQDRLNGLGLGQIQLADQITQALNSLRDSASSLIKPLGDVAIASVGVMGNVLIVFFLSLFMAADRARISSFLFRLVPPAYTDEARLLEDSVSRSFGGFLRGQAFLGAIYGLISMATSLLLGLPYLPVTAVSSGVLQAIPFFGPFVSWTPPVLVAIVFAPGATVPALILMTIGWFVLMNIIQPRLMAGAVGLHPVVVLGAVIVGSKVAGIAGAIFGIPVTAVIASFFFYYLGRRGMDDGPVAVRAARRVEEREGRPVRVPRLPEAGVDEEVEPPAAPAVTTTVRRRVRTAAAGNQARQVGPKPDPSAEPTA